MAKRKRSPVQEAAIVLLTEGLEGIDNNVLEQIEQKLRSVRQKRSQNARQIVRDESQPSTRTPTDTSSLCGGSLSPSSCVDDNEIPSGPFGHFLLQLLFELPKIKIFFEAGAKNIVAQVLERSDGRIQILRKFGPPQGLTLHEKFERFLTDRSLALSYEQYEGGQATLKAFVQSLKLVRNQDVQLAQDGTYRGKVWRMLERDVNVPGISAVICFEHTLFKKGVRTGEIGKCAEYFKKSMFTPILELAEEVSDLLAESQRIFDELVVVDAGSRDGIQSR